MEKKRIVVLISGGGSTMLSVIKACKAGEIFGDVVLVVSNNGPGRAKGVTRAESEQVPVSVVMKNKDCGGSEEIFGRRLVDILEEVKPDLIAQLGWCARTPPLVIRRYPYRNANQHPGPLDPTRLGFGGEGMHGHAVHAAVLYFAQRAGRPFPTEATVHWTTVEYDQGPLIGTKLLNTQRFLGSDQTLADRAEALAQELLPIEHALVVETLQRLCTDRWQMVCRQKPLIQPGEKRLFEEAIAAGRELFPNG